jgi:hypothetical protein
VADGLDVVAVGVEDECPVITRVVLLPQTGRAVVLAAGCQRGRVEGIDQSSMARSYRRLRNGYCLITVLTNVPFESAVASSSNTPGGTPS